MKRKGFDVEGLRIGEDAPRNRLVLACLLAATVVLQMTAERDGGAAGPRCGPSPTPSIPRIGRCSKRSAATSSRTERQKNPPPEGSLAFATGSAPASADGLDTMASPAPSSS